MYQQFKTVQHALDAFNRMQESRQQPPRPVRLQPRSKQRELGVLAEPATEAERIHAREVAASAATMRAKGYTVLIGSTWPNSRYNCVGFSRFGAVGPVGEPVNYLCDDAHEILDACPAYVRLDDFALAWHEVNCA
jgi:hypothetical protein